MPAPWRELRGDVDNGPQTIAVPLIEKQSSTSPQGPSPDQAERMGASGDPGRRVTRNEYQEGAMSNVIHEAFMDLGKLGMQKVVATGSVTISGDYGHLDQYRVLVDAVTFIGVDVYPKFDAEMKAQVRMWLIETFDQQVRAERFLRAGYNVAPRAESQLLVAA